MNCQRASIKLYLSGVRRCIAGGPGTVKSGQERGLVSSQLHTYDQINANAEIKLGSLANDRFLTYNRLIKDV